MTQTLDATVASPSFEKEWDDALAGKTLKGVKPNHKNGPVPEVDLVFTDGDTYTIAVRRGVYFEGCLINTLRRARPIHKIVMLTHGDDTVIELRSKTFPLVQLVAVNKELAAGEFPFVLTRRVDG